MSDEPMSQYLDELLEGIQNRIKQVQSPQIEAVLCGALATAMQAMVLREISEKFDRLLARTPPRNA